RQITVRSIVQLPCIQKVIEEPGLRMLLPDDYDETSPLKPATNRYPSNVIRTVIGWNDAAVCERLGGANDRPNGHWGHRSPPDWHDLDLDARWREGADWYAPPGVEPRLELSIPRSASWWWSTASTRPARSPATTRCRASCPMSCRPGSGFCAQRGRPIRTWTGSRHAIRSAGWISTIRHGHQHGADSRVLGGGCRRLPAAAATRGPWMPPLRAPRATCCTP